MDEQHPTWPETVYGAGKLAGEASARAHFRTYGMPVVVARPFNTYGTRSHFEGDSGEVHPAHDRARAVRPSGAGVRRRHADPRLHARLATPSAGLVALASARAVGRTVNLGSGAEISINDLVTLIAKAVGRPDLEPQHLPDRPGDVRRLLVDASLIRGPHRLSCPSPSWSEASRSWSPGSAAVRNRPKRCSAASRTATGSQHEDQRDR